MSFFILDGAKLSIKSSSDNRTFSGGQTVSLQCTSALCTFHQLNITWFRDGLSLPESGPVLRLGPLTAEDSGNYTCALETNQNTQSDPYSLQVEAGEEGLFSLNCFLDVSLSVELSEWTWHQNQTFKIILNELVWPKRFRLTHHCNEVWDWMNQAEVSCRSWEIESV